MAFLMERLRPAVARQQALRAGVDGPALRGGLLGGALAAGIGLLSVAAPILLLWIVTPYVEQGAGGVLHLAACVWLLAHGAGLLRPATFGAPGYGGPGVPLAVTPLLVSVLVLVPLYRAGLRAAAPPGPSAEDGADSEGEGADEEDRPGGADRDAGPWSPRPWSVLLGLVAGYLLVAVVAVAAASTGPISVAAPLAAFGWTALIAVPVAALGVRAGTGPGAWGALRRPSWLRPPEVLPSWAPEWLTRLPSVLRLDVLRLDALRPGVPAALRPVGGAAVAGRAALAGAAALFGVGGLVLLASLLAHFGAAGAMAAQSSPDLAGRLALLLLGAAVLPNAAVWAAAYATGPGFLFGGWLGPLGAVPRPAVAAPLFPLFTALPRPGRSLLGLLTLLPPLAVGAVVALIVARSATATWTDVEDATVRNPRDGDGDAGTAPARWGPTATAGVALTAALGTGLLAGLGAGASGGALGQAGLAAVGPSPYWTGLAALAWTAAVGVPGAVLLRLWFSRSASAATPAAPGSRWWRTGWWPTG